MVEVAAFCDSVMQTEGLCMQGIAGEDVQGKHYQSLQWAEGQLPHHREGAVLEAGKGTLAGLRQLCRGVNGKQGTLCCNHAAFLCPPIGISP